MNRFLKLVAGVVPFALPAVALAQGTLNTQGVVVGGTNASDILGTISSIFAVVIPLLITFAVIWVIIGVIKYATAGDEEKQGEARKMIIHAIIALFVIVSIWGLVAVLGSTFGINQNGSNTGACQPVWDPAANNGNGDFVVPPQCN